MLSEGHGNHIILPLISWKFVCELNFFSYCNKFTLIGKLCCRGLKVKACFSFFDMKYQHKHNLVITAEILYGELFSINTSNIYKYPYLNFQLFWKRQFEYLDHLAWELQASWKDSWIKYQPIDLDVIKKVDSWKLWPIHFSKPLNGKP